MIESKLDIFLVFETNSFPDHQFSVNGCKTYCRERNSFVGGLSFYGNQDIPWKVSSVEQIDSNFEIIFLIYKIENDLSLAYKNFQIKRKKLGIGFNN